MDRNTPPSPAPSRFDGGLPNGFNELLQHNAAATSSYHRDSPVTEHNQVHSQPTSRYGTPIPQRHRPHTFDTGIMQYQQRPGNAQLPGYRTSMYPHDSSPYGPIPDASQPYTTPATSPPTPSRASDIITTRSGNVIHRISGATNTLGPKGARVEKKKKKTREKAKAPKNVPNLDKPMSQIELEVEVPVADIGEYVNRSCEVRRQEVEMGKNPGRIKRPMNAFMLYRKAYQLRAKEWASQHNHQVVSRVCGLSWPMEPDHVREQFKAWAETERDNHQKAHPDYKFTPSKPSTRPVKSPAQSRLNQSDGSDLEDLDWGPGSSLGGGGHGIRASPYNNRAGTRTPVDDFETDYYGPSGGGGIYGPPPGSYHSGYGHPLGDLRGLGVGIPNRSAFEFSNPGKTRTSQYDHRDLASASQYYETSHLRNGNPGHQRQLPHGIIEDIMIDSANKGGGIHSPSQLFHPSSHHHLSPYSGGGGGGQQQYHHDSQQPASHPSQAAAHSQSQRYEPRIDPSLMFNADGSVSGGINSMLLDGSGLTAQAGGLVHLQQQQPHHQPQQSWQSTAGAAVGGDDVGQYSTGFLGLEETLSMDQASMEQQAQLLRGNPGEWHREELADAERFDMSWMDPSPTSKGGDT